ncbi:hypothetical protein [Flavobacterium humi]|uniref:Lipoprotein n=1 Tax=Flavobacterium humi TaxID=2562683 RepID=A0A4Z0L6R6_9FLAO|nr:hypothetical protein [Flavobacterium humi]TGD56675.1 hypothetical protein E4635_14630 [Flavobacterium humi]
MKTNINTPKRNSFPLLIVFLFIISLTSCKTSKLDNNNSIAAKVNYIPYYQKVYEADSLFLTENYERSYTILDSLFKIYEPLQLENVNEYSTYITCSALTGHMDNFKEKIKKGYLKFGGIGFNHPKNDSIYEIVYANNPFTKEEKQQLRQAYLSQFDSVLRKTILKMSIDDQEVRRYPLDTNKMKTVDSRHKKMIVDIFKKYGYPNYQVIGKMGTFGDKPVQFMILMMHQEYNFKKRYLKDLYKLMIHGKLSPEEYAIIVDRTYLEKNKSVYGMIQQKQVKYPENMNKLRKEIGLNAFRYEQWKDRILFPEFYKKKKL